MTEDVIAERLNNLTNMLEKHVVDNKEQRIENKQEHEGIMKRQDHTNGSVTKLQMWRTFLLGGWAVISVIVLPAFFWFFTDFIAKMEDKETAIEKSIDSKIQSAIDINNQKQFSNYIK